MARCNGEKGKNLTHVVQEKDDEFKFNIYIGYNNFTIHAASV